MSFLNRGLAIKSNAIISRASSTESVPITDSKLSASPSEDANLPTHIPDITPPNPPNINPKLIFEYILCSLKKEGSWVVTKCRFMEYITPENNSRSREILRENLLMYMYDKPMSKSVTDIDAKLVAIDLLTFSI